ncbi:MAG TPA: hypothetical protein VGK13_02925, partial [Methanocellaceae archaeon]
LECSTRVKLRVAVMMGGYRLLYRHVLCHLLPEHSGNDPQIIFAGSIYCARVTISAAIVKFTIDIGREAICNQP